LSTRTLTVGFLAAALTAAFGAGSSTGSTRSASTFHSVVVASLGPKAEVVKGSPRASGTVRVTLNVKAGEACWRLSVTGVDSKDKKLSAYVHKGLPGKTGPAIIPLGSRFSTKGCVSGVPKKSLRAVGENPRGYYVNVYTKKYVHGAVRGQLRAG
jgi:hypothetical protein